HSYTTTTANRKAIETAQLVLYDGYDLIPAIEDIVESSVDTPANKVAVYEEAVTEPIMAKHDHHEHEGEELEADPHVWHNVQNVIAAVEVIEKELAAVNPEEKQFYEDNAKQFKRELEELDSWVKKQVATIPQQKRTLVTTHEAFNYYIQAYGFEGSEALQGLSTEDSPAAADVKKLVKMLRETQVPTIFSEAASNDKIIATVAREAAVKVAEESLLTDALGKKDSETGTYIGMMVTNTCTIVEGLDGQCNGFF
ncbi:MAG: metal ABC transporter substrate-binding protein, partial [Spirulinaceae cyanobacterium]